MQPAELAVELTGLRKQFGAVRAVEDVTFHVRQGEVFGVLGPNGAGKTTTIECLVGAISRDAGAVSVLGVDPRIDRKAIRQSVGYQLQSAMLPPLLTVAEVVTMFAALYANPADASELMNLIGLDDLARRKVRTLSGGQRQRLSIAVALIGNPRIAVLDELTTGLDPQARRNTWRLIADIRGRGITIVLVTHGLDEADQLCDRLVVIDQGRTRFMGTPSELRDRVASETGRVLSLEDSYLRLLDDSAAFE